MDKYKLKGEIKLCVVDYENKDYSSFFAQAEDSASRLELTTLEFLNQFKLPEDELDLLIFRYQMILYKSNNF